MAGVDWQPIPIVALDFSSADAALQLVDRLGDQCLMYKVGNELFTTAGPDIVHQLRKRGASIFLDLKFHDIPNTVSKAVASAVRLDVQMLTIHTSGGLAMMQAAEEAAQKTAAQAGRNAPLVLGVTVLTSLESENLLEIGVAGSVGSQVERLAQLAARAELRGLVCSPLEVAGLRQSLPSHMQYITPGIRTGEDAAGDQKRTLSAKQALEAGATWLVIGRPIYAAPNPRAAAEAILASLH